MEVLRDQSATELPERSFCLPLAFGRVAMTPGVGFGPMESACHEIDAARRLFHLRWVAKASVDAWLFRSDQMLTELEKLNLADVKFAPESWRVEFGCLVSDVPFRFRRGLSGGDLSPTEALDAVFALQSRLLRLRTSPSVGEKVEDEADDDDQELKAS